MSKNTMRILTDYIVVLEDMISDNICDEILKEYSNSIDCIESVIGDNNEVNKTVRNCDSIFISSDETINKNITVRQNLDKELFECFNKCIKLYNNKFKEALVSKDTGYFLLKYERGDFYKEHVDSFTTVPRTISCSLILNNDFEGGSFSFFKNEFMYFLKKRSIIMFPSNFIYPHAVLPVIKGTRYSIVTWFI
jgi:predicted 2-oxoglutarate/Fe(II)-dependent dioxygenase YbiX